MQGARESGGGAAHLDLYLDRVNLGLSRHTEDAGARAGGGQRMGAILLARVAQDVHVPVV